ncbi:MAG: AraC family transcriptional regulator, partial [Firmicutes bacterium HGW-Firmicutes-6]
MEEAQIFQAVQRMQDYIETNLTRKITLKELANAAGYSP